MRHEKAIIIKNSYLRRIRYDLRRLYRNHYFPIRTKYSEESKELERKNSVIFNASICNCPSCNSIAKDMIYNKHEGKWYCLDCYYSIKARNTDPADWPLSKAEIRIFLKELAGSEGCQYNGREWRCGGKDFTYAHRVLDIMRFSKDQQDVFLNYCKAFGGHCDCEILMNAAPHLLGEKTHY